MKNLTIYIGTIKKCLDIKNYQKYGDEREKVDFEERTMTSVTELISTISYVDIVTNSAILVKTPSDNFYHLKISSGLKDYLNIVCDNEKNIIPDHPEDDKDIFFERNSLRLCCEVKPKVLALRKAKDEIILDPRTHFGIEN